MSRCPWMCEQCWRWGWVKYRSEANVYEVADAIKASHRERSPGCTGSRRAHPRGDTGEVGWAGGADVSTWTDDRQEEPMSTWYGLVHPDRKEIFSLGGRSYWNPAEGMPKTPEEWTLARVHAWAGEQLGDRIYVWSYGDDGPVVSAVPILISDGDADGQDAIRVLARFGYKEVH